MGSIQQVSRLLLHHPFRVRTQLGLQHLQVDDMFVSTWAASGLCSVCGHRWQMVADVGRCWQMVADGGTCMSCMEIS